MGYIAFIKVNRALGYVTINCWSALNMNIDIFLLSALNTNIDTFLPMEPCVKHILTSIDYLVKRSFNLLSLMPL